MAFIKLSYTYLIEKCCQENALIHVFAANFFVLLFLSQNMIHFVHLTLECGSSPGWQVEPFEALNWDLYVSVKVTVTWEKKHKLQRAKMSGSVTVPPCDPVA